MRAGWLTLILLMAPLAGCIGGLGNDDDAIDPTATPGEELRFTDTHVFPGEYDFAEDWSVVVSPGPYEVLDGQVEMLTSEADGVDIQLSYVLPDVPEGTQVPVIVHASPYHPAHQTVDFDQFHQRIVENFVPHGYAVAFVAVRGTADSGGCIELFGPNERADLDQAITYLATREWSNGNAAMIGVSYDGSTPWMVAALGNPHLKTIVPISGLSDVYNLEYRNGTVEQRMLGLVNLLYYAYGFGINNPANGRSAEHTVEGVVCPGTFEGIAASMESAATGERDSLGYFADRNLRPLVEENYEGSVFLIHGLQDWNVDPHHAYPWMGELEAKGFTVKHLLGQWGHAWPDGSYLSDDIRRYDFAEVLLHWFDHELKGDTTVDVGPKVQVQDSQLLWRSETSWPPADAEPVTFYLGGNGAHVAGEGALVLDASEAADATVPLAPDGSLIAGEPLPVPEACAGCAAWTTGVLQEDLRFAGLPRVHVTVTPSIPGGTVAAFLYAVDGGQWERLGWTQMDLRFHEGGETAQTVVPGQPILAKLQLEPLDAVAPAGSQLVLVLTVGTQHDRLNVGMGTPVVVNVGGEASTLTLDVFERGEDAFFEPPRPS